MPNKKSTVCKTASSFSPAFQVFSTPGVFTLDLLPPNVCSVIIELWGGGGGGAGSSDSDFPGAGGGGGANVKATVAIERCTKVVIQVGSGGLGGTGAATGLGTSGTNGGDTTFQTSSGVTLSAGGGRGGVAALDNLLSNAGAGGIAAGGPVCSVVLTNGQNGQVGSDANNVGGNGGSSSTGGAGGFGGNGDSTELRNGTVGLAPGGGGGGGSESNAGSGGNGAVGRAILYFSLCC